MDFFYMIDMHILKIWKTYHVSFIFDLKYTIMVNFREQTSSWQALGGGGLPETTYFSASSGPNTWFAAISKASCMMSFSSQNWFVAARFFWASVDRKSGRNLLICVSAYTGGTAFSSRLYHLIQDTIEMWAIFFLVSKSLTFSSPVW